MESQPQNPEFWINPENFHPWNASPGVPRENIFASFGSQRSILIYLILIHIVQAFWLIFCVVLFLFIIYYVMKYRKILIEYNAYISQPCKI